MIAKKYAIPLIVVIMATAIVYIFIFLPKRETIRVSTTTSLYATGLLDFLADQFRAKRPEVNIHFIAVGSGAALELAAKGDVDMVFVHAPSLEYEYIQQEVLVEGVIIAYNNFTITGPMEDPAEIQGLDPIAAFKRIYSACEEGKTIFVSRGDNSGTHTRELLLWKLAGLDPQGKKWYIETGTGMTETLLTTNEMRAYTLSDMGTYLKLKREGRLPNIESLVSSGRELINIYSVYLVNHTMFPHTKYNLAKEFAQFVTSEEGQELIGQFGVDVFGEPLFYPALDRRDELRQIWEWFAEISLEGSTTIKTYEIYYEYADPPDLYRENISTLVKPA